MARSGGGYWDLVARWDVIRCGPGDDQDRLRSCCAELRAHVLSLADRSLGKANPVLAFHAMMANLEHHLRPSVGFDDLMRLGILPAREIVADWMKRNVALGRRGPHTSQFFFAVGLGEDGGLP